VHLDSEQRTLALIHPSHSMRQHRAGMRCDWLWLHRCRRCFGSAWAALDKRADHDSKLERPCRAFRHAS